jgi:hypothetical protein
MVCCLLIVRANGKKRTEKALVPVWSIGDCRQADGVPADIEPPTKFPATLRGNGSESGRVRRSFAAADFLTGAARRGVSVFKMHDVSRQKSMEVLRAKVRDADLFRYQATAAMADCQRSNLFWCGHQVTVRAAICGYSDVSTQPAGPVR